MNLNDIGYNSIVNKYVEDIGLDKSNIGRVVVVFKDRYIIRTDSKELKANVTGNFQYSIEYKSELPVIGDWVHLHKYDNNTALITQVLSRNNYLERRAVGKSSNKQIIAANIDFGFIVEAITENFNLNRIERYLSICNSANVKPVILLTKIDLSSEYHLKKIMNMVGKRLDKVPLFAISNLTNAGIDDFKTSLIKGKTYCLLGLSGVGKSTLINNLIAKKVMKTNTISDSTKKGVHTTSHRQLFLLSNGSIIIDNPGMREVGITESTDGIEITFDIIFDLAEGCKFSDCTHTHEKDCAVLTAVDKGTLDKATYNNFIKMKREQFHFQATLLEKRRKDKIFGKMVKNLKKNTNLKQH